MDSSPLTLRDFLSLLALVMVLMPGVLFVTRLGSKLDRLSDAIERLAQSMDDHEDRLRVLERGAT